MDKNEEAIAVFKKAIEIDPLDSGAHWSLGEALLSKGNAAEAIPVLKKAEELDPRDPLPPVILARAFASLQNYPEAFSSSRRSLELGPRTWSEDSFVLLDQLFRQTSDSPLPPESVDRMIEALEKALEAGGTNSAFLLAGLALAWIDHPSRKDPVRACDCALRAAKASRGVNPWIILTLSRIEFEAGKTRDAILRLEEASRVSEWDTGDWFDFSRMLGDLLERYRNALLPGFGSFASIDDAVSRSEEEVLVPEGASWSFFRGRAEPSAGMEWTATDFDDSAWEKGAGGFGYQDGDDATVLTDMKGNYTTVYIRNVFTMPEAAPYQRCRLSVKADDGFVAYLNGVEVARARAGSRGRRMAFDAVATQSADEPLVPVQVELEVGRFREGRNCLAIQGLNQARDSSDFSLIPVLLGESRTDPGRIHMLLAKFRGVAAGEDSKGLLAYFEGRILEREGKHREAIAFFSEAEALAPSRPEPVLQGAECLRALKDPAAAERKLREAIEKGMEDRRLWDLWIEISFLDLGRAPGEVLKAFPRGNPDTRGEDFRWLLKRLSAGEAIRLVSGGEDYRSPQGISWSRDRFFRGGLSYLPFMTKRVRYPGSIRNTEDATLYRSERFFFGSGPVGYRVPLPSGSYRVTLHFAEIFYWEPGKRVFDVLLEGKEVLRDYDPFSAVGFAAADRKTFLLRVEDGFLDLEFVREAGNPKISALEIERVE
jgi:tetratricopeptide (TPR) repeat protein